MDPDRFEPALHALFDEFPVSPNPNGRRFTRILEEVPGLACENNLALLNLGLFRGRPDYLMLPGFKPPEPRAS